MALDRANQTFPADFYVTVDDPADSYHLNPLRAKLTSHIAPTGYTPAVTEGECEMERDRR